MELIFKVVSAGVLTAVVCLLIKRTNPEMSISVSICAVSIITALSLGFAQGLSELIDTAKKVADIDRLYYVPVLKCAAIGIVTRIGSEISKDASQGAVASAVELAGALCAFSVTLPLVISVLKMIGTVL